MPGELPYFIEGKVVEIAKATSTAYVKVCNGNVYHLTPFTPGIVFSELSVGATVRCEITSRLIRVLSAKLIT